MNWSSPEKSPLSKSLAFTRVFQSWPTTLKGRPPPPLQKDRKVSPSLHPQVWGQQGGRKWGLWKSRYYQKTWNLLCYYDHWCSSWWNGSGPKHARGNQMEISAGMLTLFRAKNWFFSPHLPPFTPSLSFMYEFVQKNTESSDFFPLPLFPPKGKWQKQHRQGKGNDKDIVYALWNWRANFLSLFFSSERWGGPVWN